MSRLPFFFVVLMISNFALAGEQATKARCSGGGLQVDVEMDEIGDNFFTIQGGGAKASYANNSSNLHHKGPSTVTAVLDENVGVLAVVGLNISDSVTMQETTLISVPKSYQHKPGVGAAPGDATFSANLTGPMTKFENLLVKCTLHSTI